MRAMQTARVGRCAPVRMDSGGTAWGAESGVGAGAGVDGGVSAVIGDARKHWLGGMVFREEKFWQGRASGIAGERGGCDVDAGERVARGEGWPTVLKV